MLGSLGAEAAPIGIDTSRPLDSTNVVAINDLKPAVAEPSNSQNMPMSGNLQGKLLNLDIEMQACYISDDF